MTTRFKAAAAAATVTERPPPSTEEVPAMRERRNPRAGFWRLALGALGLFWVCVLILLMR